MKEPRLASVIISNCNYVFASPCAGWLDVIPGFRRFLATQYRIVLSNDRITIFDRRPDRPGRRGAPSRSATSTTT